MIKFIYDIITNECINDFDRSIGGHIRYCSPLLAVLHFKKLGLHIQ